MSSRPAAKRMAAAESILPKVSGEIKAVLPKSTKIASNAIESVSTTGSQLPRNLQLTPTSDLAEAARTGRPVAGLAPGTYSPRYSEAYQKYIDSYLEDIRPRGYIDDDVVAARIAEQAQEYNTTLADTTQEFRNMGLTEDEATKTADAILAKRYNDATQAGIREAESASFPDGVTGLDADRLAKSVAIAKNARPVIAMDQGDLEKVLKEGRYKTQFETGTSSGQLDPDLRRRVETQLFGYHPSTDPTKRPVYGYLAKGGELNETILDEVGGYGNVHVVLKPDVNQRTTFTGVDSLFPRIDAAPLNAPTKDVIPPGMNWRSYAEAQIHGGVSVSDIDYATGVVSDLKHEELISRRIVNQIGSDKVKELKKSLSKKGIKFIPMEQGDKLNVNTLEITSPPITPKTGSKEAA